MKKYLFAVLLIILGLFIYLMSEIEETNVIKEVFGKEEKLGPIINHEDENYYIGEYDEIISKPNMREYVYSETGSFKIVVITDQDVKKHKDGTYNFDNVNNATYYKGLAGSFYLYVGNNRILDIETFNEKNYIPSIESHYIVKDREIIKLSSIDTRIIDSTGKNIFDDLVDLEGSLLDETKDGVIIKTSYIDFNDDEYRCIVCSNNSYCKNIDTKDDYTLEDIIYDKYLLDFEDGKYKVSLLEGVSLEKYIEEQKEFCEMESIN